MKKILILIMAASMLACSSDPVEKLVADYEQTIFDSKLDLSFEMLEINLLREHTVEDSLAIYLELYDEMKKDRIDHLEAMIEQMREQIATSEFPEVVESFTKRTEEFQAELERLNNGVEQTASMAYLDKEMNRLKSLSQPLYGYIYECRYSILNPLLDVKQEITNTYLIDPEKTRIIKKIEKD